MRKIKYENKTASETHVSFFDKKNFYKKMSLKNPKTLRQCLENLQPQMPELQFLKIMIAPRAL